MPLDPKLLSTYLAMIQAKKLRDAQAAQDATKVSTPTPPVANFSDSGYPMGSNPNNSFAALAAISKLRQSSKTTQSPMKKDMNDWNDWGKSIIIKDSRTQDAVSGTKISDTNNLGSKAHLFTVKEIIRAAREAKIDPYTALAVAHQETGLSSDYADNPMRIRYDSNQLGANSNKNSVELAMDIMNDKNRIAKSRGKTDEASIIQAWNGYGKVGKNTEGKQNFLYGIDVSKEDIDMDTNPVYGKRVLDIRENIIKKNPELVKLIESTK